VNPVEKSLENLGFLLQDVARLMRSDFNRRVEELELTQAQWRALALLWRNPGISQRQLAQILEMQPISVARLIDRMQKRGWVERRPDPADRRAVKLYLTERAEPIMTRMRKHAADMRAFALGGVSQKEQKQLLDVLFRMRTNLAATDFLGEKP
jgi:MarR family transcriptional regulator, transcriptional regulator for hemolysin